MTMTALHFADLLGDVLHEVDPQRHAVDVHEHALRAVGSDESVVQSSGGVLRVLAAVADKDAAAVLRTSVRWSGRD